MHVYMIYMGMFRVAWQEMHTHVLYSHVPIKCIQVGAGLSTLIQFLSLNKALQQGP